MTAAEKKPTKTSPPPRKKTAPKQIKQSPADQNKQALTNRAIVLGNTIYEATRTINRCEAERRDIETQLAELDEKGSK